MYHEHQIPIWFFIGLLLLLYGILILGYGVYSVVNPPEHPVKLAYLHADIWWGIVLLVIGLIYGIKYRPSKKQS
jgi:hypothetical protein